MAEEGDKIPFQVWQLSNVLRLLYICNWLKNNVYKSLWYLPYFSPLLTFTTDRYWDQHKKKMEQVGKYVWVNTIYSCFWWKLNAHMEWLLRSVRSLSLNPRTRFRSSCPRRRVKSRPKSWPSIKKSKPSGMSIYYRFDFFLYFNNHSF